jgi:hypothetical protein
MEDSTMSGRKFIGTTTRAAVPAKDFFVKYTFESFDLKS